MRLLPVLLLLPTAAIADDCIHRLQTLLATDLAANGPYIAMNANVMAGQEQLYRQSFVSDRHFLVETIQPPGVPVTLHHEGGAWHGDGAGGWTLAWQMDAEEAAAGMAAQRQAAAAAVEGAACATKDGVERVEGTLGPTPHLGETAVVTFEVDTATGDVTALTYDYSLNGIAILATYAIARAPDLTLPLPPGN